jgi:hypothetical protein
MTHRDEHKTERPESSSAKPRRKYIAPALRVYGNVASLTRNVGNTGTVLDSGHGAMSKTS